MIIAFLLVGGVIVYLLFQKIRQMQSIGARESLISDYQFPKGIEKKIIEKYPHLRPGETYFVMQRLRDYFHICNRAGKSMVSMPSQVVDVAWHEFILYTREYKKFCDTCLGRFLHHTPAEAMKSRTKAQRGIQIAWQHACKLAGINIKNPDRLPLIFAIDATLKIPDGFIYSLNCNSAGQSGDAYCASHIGCGSGCGSGGDSGCGGGCGGD